ncbi:MAG: hypothetical protein LAP13_07105 [Acidobacteriia bacterium]|nr:hypothetical protein [Terriglobia bacterium]
MSTTEANWDEHWLHDLHLFNVVVSDAQQCSTHAPEIKMFIDLGDFYEALVCKQQNSLATLLHSYAAQDAAAAFRLADICGLDLLESFPQVVVSNCDQHPFFALVAQRAINDGNRIGAWAQLLAEAGLRSPLVASMMQDTDPEGQLEDSVAQVPIRESWELGALLRKSFYLQIITLALTSESKVHCRCPILDVLRRTPAPGRLWWRRVLYGHEYPVFAAGSLCVVGLLILSYGLVSALGTIRNVHGPTFIAVMLIFSLLYYVLLRALGLSTFYRTMLNLRNVSKTPSRSSSPLGSAFDIWTLAIFPSEGRLLREVAGIREGVSPASVPQAGT